MLGWERLGGASAKCAKSLLAEETGRGRGEWLALEWEEGEEQMGGGLHYLDDESWNGFEVR
jgi:hypothetical protein